MKGSGLFQLLLCSSLFVGHLFDDCSCSSVEFPVCGSDGKTYKNSCVAFDCNDLPFIYEGACGSPRPPTPTMPVPRQMPVIPISSTPFGFQGFRMPLSFLGSRMQLGFPGNSRFIDPRLFQ